MLYYLAISATIVSLFFLSVFPFNGILLTLLLKPIIDTAWNYQFAGFNLLQVVGVFVPIVILPNIIVTNGINLFKLPLAIVACVYLFSNCLGVMGLIAGGHYIDAINLFFRSLNGTLGFFMFQTYFHELKSFRNLILFLLLAGLFPVIVGLFQAVTGVVWSERVTVGLVRNVGLYHDAFNIRAYGFQTLTAILLAWSYFYSRFRLLTKPILSLYGVLCCFVIFKSFSKAAVLVFVCWIVIWSLLNRKFLWIVTIPLFLTIINIANENQMTNEVRTLFSKEVGAIDGSIEDRYILAGRTVVWNEYWQKWRETGTFEKLFGTGMNPPTHNEYLRLLYCNGILGVGIYIFLIIIIGIKIGFNIFKDASPLNVMALMIFTMWVIDTIGLHPGMYPSYQWYVWGLIGLSLRGVSGLEKTTLKYFR